MHWFTSFLKVMLNIQLSDELSPALPELGGGIFPIGHFLYPVHPRTGGAEEVLGVAL